MKKEHCYTITDYLNTNVNHGNDFCSRMIAQGILTAMTYSDELVALPDVPEQVENMAGDINKDECVNLKDLVIIARLQADWENLIYNKNTVDVNGDNSFDLNDVIYLARHLAGWEEYEPVINENLPDSELPNQTESSNEQEGDDVDMDIGEEA